MIVYVAVAALATTIVALCSTLRLAPTTVRLRMAPGQIALLFGLALVGCGSSSEEPADAGPCDATIPGDAAPLVVACFAGRDVDNPCITSDGTSLRHGECCVNDGGYLGTCIAYDPYDKPLAQPFCDTLE